MPQTATPPGLRPRHDDEDERIVPPRNVARTPGLPVLILICLAAIAAVSTMVGIGLHRGFL